MKKKFLSLVIAAIMIAGASITACAEDYQGSNSWLVKFNGTKIESNFASEQLADDISDVQPGDSITFQVNLENASGKATDWYMTNEVLKTLEDSNNTAEGGSYTYILTYVDHAGKETTLYSSRLIGGEADAENTEKGLHQATDSLEDYFYLDRMETAEKGVVKLYVGIEGETIGTAYQQSLAKLKMNFAVEKVPEEKVVVKVSESNASSNVSESKGVAGAKTADPAQPALFGTAAILSGFVLFLAADKFAGKRSRRG